MNELCISDNWVGLSNGISTPYALFNAKIIHLWMFDLNHNYIFKHLYCFNQITILNTNDLHIVLWFQVFLSNINNLYTVIWFQVFLFNTNNLHTFIWFQVFLFNTNNLHTFIWFQVFLSKTNNLHIVIWFQVFLSNINNLHTVIVWLGCVEFYGISTIVGYLMPNPLYMYIKYMISKHILLITSLNKPEFILFTHS